MRSDVTHACRSNTSNLLGNAVKFVAPGKTPEGRVWAEQRKRDVRLWFEGNGIVLSPQNQEQLFQTFYRVRMNYEGIEAGLALECKKIKKWVARWAWNPNRAKTADFVWS